MDPVTIKLTVTKVEEKEIDKWNEKGEWPYIDFDPNEWDLLQLQKVLENEFAVVEIGD